eukprot:1195199-Prorocentrum_minimum.AAC.2
MGVGLTLWGGLPVPAEDLGHLRVQQLVLHNGEDVQHPSLVEGHEVGHHQLPETDILTLSIYCLPSCDWFSRGIHTASPLAIGSHVEYTLPPLLRSVLTRSTHCLPSCDWLSVAICSQVVSRLLRRIQAFGFDQRFAPEGVIRGLVGMLHHGHQPQCLPEDGVIQRGGGAGRLPLGSGVFLLARQAAREALGSLGRGGEVLGERFILEAVVLSQLHAS